MPTEYIDHTALPASAERPVPEETLLLLTLHMLTEMQMILKLIPFASGEAPSSSVHRESDPPRLHISCHDGEFVSGRALALSATLPRRPQMGNPGEVPFSPDLPTPHICASMSRSSSAAAGAPRSRIAEPVRYAVVRPSPPPQGLPFIFIY